MGPLAVTFGIATALTVAWVFVARSRCGGLPARAAALSLSAIWLVCRIAELGLGWGISPDVYAFLDVLGCAAATMIYSRWGGHWLVWLALTYVGQSVLHLVYQVEWHIPGGIFAYVLGLNILFGCQLAIVAYGGRDAAHVLRDLRQRLLRRLFGARAAGAVPPGVRPAVDGGQGG